MPKTFITGHGPSVKYHIRSGAYPDLTIRCGRIDHDVHQAVLCPRSKFFEACCKGHFEESQTRIIDLSDDDAGAVSRMLQFLYTHIYDDGISGTDKIMMNNALTYAIGEKYELPDLKAFAKIKFNSNADHIRFHAFAPVVNAIYETTPAEDVGLREDASRICARHVKEIMVDPEWRSIMKEHGAFALAMSDAATKTYGDQIEWLTFLNELNDRESKAMDKTW